MAIYLKLDGLVYNVRWLLLGASFLELRKTEVQLPRIPLPRTPMHKHNLTTVVPWHILPSRKGERGDTAVVDAFLTLVIALGGIATGIGAIWTAVAARRQAQLSERSLTQSERSLSEQIQTLREQNERARLTLEYDLLERQAARFDNPQWRRTVKAAAKFTLDNVFVDDEVVAAERLNYPASEVCNFYEGVGEMLRLGVLRHALVWNRYSLEIQGLWRTYEPTIKKMREES